MRTFQIPVELAPIKRVIIGTEHSNYYAPLMIRNLLPYLSQLGFTHFLEEINDDIDSAEIIRRRQRQLQDIKSARTFVEQQLQELVDQNDFLAIKYKKSFDNNAYEMNIAVDYLQEKLGEKMMRIPFNVTMRINRLNAINETIAVYQTALHHNMTLLGVDHSYARDAVEKRLYSYSRVSSFNPFFTLFFGEYNALRDEQIKKHVMQLSRNSTRFILMVSNDHAKYLSDYPPLASDTLFLFTEYTCYMARGPLNTSLYWDKVTYDKLSYCFCYNLTDEHSANKTAVDISELITQSNSEARLTAYHWNKFFKNYNHITQSIIHTLPVSLMKSCLQNLKRPSGSQALSPRTANYLTRSIYAASLLVLGYTYSQVAAVVAFPFALDFLDLSFIPGQTYKETFRSTMWMTFNLTTLLLDTYSLSESVSNLFSITATTALTSFVGERTGKSMASAINHRFFNRQSLAAQQSQIRNDHQEGYWIRAKKYIGSYF